MNIKPFAVPKPLGNLVSLMPQYPHSVILTTFLNLVLGQTFRPEDLEPLHGKHLHVRVKDAGINFHFSVNSRGFVPRRPLGQPDVTISADTYDFVALGLRQEDPDTLFFSRRLVMEGDTELGLFIKNTLDALELPPLDISVLHPSRVLAMAKSRALPGSHQ